MHYQYILLLIASASVSLAVESCQDNYCCDGQILRKDNSNSLSAEDLICCEGSGQGILLGKNSPTSCSAGNQIPLTQASSKEGSGISPKTASSSSSAAMTDSGSSSGTTAAAGSNDTPTSTSDNGAMVTSAPLVGALLAAGGLALAI